MGEPLWETPGKFLEKLKIEPLCDPATPLLGTYLKNPTNSKRYPHRNIHSSIIYSSQDVETTQASINNQWTKMWYIYRMEYYSAIKRI